QLIVIPTEVEESPQFVSITEHTETTEEKSFTESVPCSLLSTAGNVLMQHLEGAAWTFLTIARYNSWEDFATGEKNSIATTTNKDSPWYQLREHAAFHTDTLTDRIAP